MAERNIILEKSLEFALEIIEYSELLEAKRKYVISNQLLKSGTSIGANINEAQPCESRADFIHKLTTSPSLTVISLTTPATSAGTGDKAQVGQMVARILRLSAVPKPADSADALALAICQIWRGPALARLNAAVNQHPYVAVNQHPYVAGNPRPYVAGNR